MTLKFDGEMIYHIKGKFLGTPYDFEKKFGILGNHNNIVSFAGNLDYNYWNGAKIAGKIKNGDKVLWLNTLHGKNELEAGDIIDVYDHLYSLIWLEGYKSRNETLTDADIIAVWDGNSNDKIRLDFLEGTGHLTEVGKAWVAQFKTGKEDE